MQRALTGENYRTDIVVPRRLSRLVYMDDNVRHHRSVAVVEVLQQGAIGTLL